MKEIFNTNKNIGFIIGDMYNGLKLIIHKEDNSGIFNIYTDHTDFDECTFTGECNFKVDSYELRELAKEILKQTEDR